MNTGWLITRNSKHVMASPITVEHYLREKLSKDRQTETLQDKLRHFEKQAQQDENYTYAETSHHKQAPTAVESKTTNTSVEVTSLSDNCLDTDNDNTVDDSQNGLIATK